MVIELPRTIDLRPIAHLCRKLEISDRKREREKKRNGTTVGNVWENVGELELKFKAAVEGTESCSTERKQIRSRDVRASP